jgi:hypothetical protein
MRLEKLQPVCDAVFRYEFADEQPVTAHVA